MTALSTALSVPLPSTLPKLNMRPAERADREAAATAAGAILAQAQIRTDVSFPALFAPPCLLCRASR